MKMKAYFLLACFAAFVAHTAESATTGSCEESAKILVPKESLQTQNFALTREYDSWDGTYSSETYVYYAQINLQRGQAYTISVEVYGTSETALEKVWSVTGDPGTLDALEEYGEGDNQYTKYSITAKSWEGYDGDTAVFMIEAMGESGGKIKVSYKTGVDLPAGMHENPEVVSPGEGFSPKTVTLTENHNGSYVFAAYLEKGRKYRFVSTSGTEEDPVSFFIDPGPLSQDAIGESGNSGAEFFADSTGQYEIEFLTGSDRLTVEYGAYPGRPVSSHPCNILTAGAVTEFEPGRRNEEGTGYYDTIIDKTLFLLDESVFASAPQTGARCAVTVTAGSAPVEAEIYDSTGEVMLSVEIAAGAWKRLAFTGARAGKYYLGVCQADEENYEAGDKASVQFLLVDDMEGAFDAFDTADDSPDGAMPLSPALDDKGGGPAEADETGHGPHTLSVKDWTDVFKIAVRDGCVYSFYADSAGGGDSELSAQVFTIDRWGGREEMAGVAGDLADSSNPLTFVADGNGVVYVAVSCRTTGADYGPYTMRAAVRVDGDTETAMLKVSAKGLQPDSTATWRITSGTSGNEVDYPFGTAIPVPADANITVEFAAVDGFSKPQSWTGTVSAGGVECIAEYSDTFDPGDDSMGAATAISFQPATNSLSRTLWENDSADWFSFSGQAGIYYVAVVDAGASKSVRLAFCDSTGAELASGTGSAGFGAPASGTFYLKVSHASGEEAGKDAAYKLFYNSVDTGFVSFAQNGVFTVAKGAEWAEAVVTRSSAQGAVRLRYGTHAGTATPGEDYEPASGILEWADGDSSQKTIRIKLIPDLRAGSEDSENFKILIAPLSDALLRTGEYPAVVSGTTAATMTIEDVAPAAHGTVNIVASGDGAEAISGGRISGYAGYPLKIWVSRDGGSDGPAAVAIDVATAGPGTDAGYAPATETLTWESGESGRKLLLIRHGPPPYEPESGAFAPVKISISPALDGTATGRNTVVADIFPESQKPVLSGDEAGGYGQAYGSFRGVLAAEDDTGAATDQLCNLVFTAGANGLRAVAEAGGRTFEFTAQSYSYSDLEEDYYCEATFSGIVEIDGETYENTATVYISASRIAGLEDEDSGFNEAKVILNIPDPSGSGAQTLEFSGALYRDNRATGAIAGVASLFKGHYTAVLECLESASDGSQRGNGRLVFDIAADGSVQYTAAMPGGIEMSGETVAGFLYGDGYGDAYSDTAAEFYAIVPMYSLSNGTLFGGNLSIKFEYGGKPVICQYGGYSSSYLIWNETGDAQTGGEGETRLNLEAAGGYFDSAVDMNAMLYGETLIGIDSSTGEVFEIDSLTVAADGVADGNLSVGDTNFLFAGTAIQNSMDNDGMYRMIGGGMVQEGGDSEASVNGSRPVLLYAVNSDLDVSEDYGFMATISFSGGIEATGAGPAALSGAVGDSIYLPGTGGLSRTGYEFVGWSMGASVFQPGDIFEIPVTNAAFQAKWTISTAGVAEAVDSPSLQFTGDGAAGWFPQSAMFKQGVEGNVSAIRSGTIGNNQSSWVETVLSGAGRLSFWYKISSEQNYDKLTVAIDGVEAGSYSGEIDWTLFEKDLGPGLHTIRWTYAKDGGGTRGDDAVWVDLLKFGPLVAVSFVPGENGSMVSNSVLYVAGSAYGELPVPDYGDEMTFLRWEDPAGAEVSATSIVPANDITLYAAVTSKLWHVSFDFTGGGAADEIILLGAAGETVALPGEDEVTREGYVLSGWEIDGIRYSPGDDYTVPKADVTLAAIWSFDTSDYEEALGAQSMLPAPEFEAGGDAPWTLEYLEGEDGELSACLRSGSIADSQTTWFEAILTGSGAFMFEYMVSSENNYDKLTVWLDGAEAVVFSGDVPWTNYLLEIKDSGTDDEESVHVVKFVYSKDSGGSRGEDCARIRNVTFGKTVDVAFVAEGGTLDFSARKYIAGQPFGTMPAASRSGLTFITWVCSATLDEFGADDIVPDYDYDGIFDGVLELDALWGATVSYDIGTDATGEAPDPETTPVFNGTAEPLILPDDANFENPGRAFAGWTDGSTVYAPGDEYAPPAHDVTLSAVWSLSVDDIAGALGMPESVALSADGDAPWFVQTGMVRTEGGSAVQSGAISNNGTTTLSASFQGAGRLSFWYKVSSEQNYDKLTVTVDGAVAGTYSGEADWSLFETELAGGSHSVEWKYTKDGSTGKGQDAAWIADFAFQKMTEVVFDPKGGAMETNTVHLASGQPYGKLPVPNYGGLYTFAGWTDAQGNAVSAADIVPDGTVTLHASIVQGEAMAKVLSALGGNVEVVLNPAAPWFSQSAETHNGPEALQSAKAGANSRTAITIVFSGKGDLSFWYKVSSEQNYDKLTITLDGIETGVYSGETGWTEFARTMGDGPHELVLSYSKDATADRGSDAAWLADFVWTPAAQSVEIAFDSTVESVQLADGTEVSAGAHVMVGSEGVSLTVKAAAWRTPSAAGDSPAVTAAAVSDGESNMKTFVLNATGAGVLTVTGTPYTGDGDGMIEAGGRRVPAAKATSWGIVNAVAEEDFSEYYNDYLLNDIPGSGGVLVVSGVDIDRAAGKVAITVRRSGGGFSFDAINGRLVILTADAPGGAYTAIAEESVAIKNGRDSAVAVFALPAGNAAFFKAEIR